METVATVAGAVIVGFFFVVGVATVSFAIFDHLDEKLRNRYAGE